MAKRIIISLVKIIVYVVFVVAAIYFTPKILAKVLHTPYPLATITSGSMWPILKVNDLILMKGITADQSQVGQIVVYKSQEQGFTVHRLIRRENGKLIFKGDANQAEDSPVAPGDVIGRIVYAGKSPFRIPFLGIVARGLGPKLKKM